MALPVLQALLLADHVYQDAPSGKFVICGVFGVLHLIPTPKATAQQPKSDQVIEAPIASLMRVGSPWAYVSLTEVHGEKKFELRYVSLDDNKPLLGTEFTITCRDPLQTIQLRVALPPLPTPHLGTYALELLCDGHPLGSHRVLVKPVQSDEPPTEEE